MTELHPYDEDPNKKSNLDDSVKIEKSRLEKYLDETPCENPYYGIYKNWDFSHDLIKNAILGVSAYFLSNNSLPIAIATAVVPTAADLFCKIRDMKVVKGEVFYSSNLVAVRQGYHLIKDVALGVVAIKALADNHDKIDDWYRYDLIKEGSNQLSYYAKKTIGFAGAFTAMLSHTLSPASHIVAAAANLFTRLYMKGADDQPF